MSEGSLRRYAEWYYTRYFPSETVLREKILQKSHDVEQVEAVMLAIKEMLVEEKVIESRARSYLNRGKSFSYIARQLRSKKFNKNLVHSVLGDLSVEIQGIEHYLPYIHRDREKGQSQLYSKRKMVFWLHNRYPECGADIEEALSSYNDRDILHRLMPEMLKISPVPKVIQKCLQKGFSMSDIKHVLRSL